MENDNRTVPIYIAAIMIECLGDNLLTAKERDDLDAWLIASEENVDLFEEMVTMVQSRKEEPWLFPEDPEMAAARRFYQ